MSGCAVMSGVLLCWDVGRVWVCRDVGRVLTGLAAGRHSAETGAVTGLVDRLEKTGRAVMPDGPGWAAHRLRGTGYAERTVSVAWAVRSVRAGYSPVVAWVRG